MTERSWTLQEYAARTPALRAAAHHLYARLGLQRARVRTITLRADLTDAQGAVQQPFLDPAGGVVSSAPPTRHGPASAIKRSAREPSPSGLSRCRVAPDSG
ncbi:hypothetical protein ABZ341_31635 [Streptomyces sp. NPDC006173]|uniref:hypothetical protein n=1 Tax=Streptomyces sp. NPDC006173 TaxID=3155349 RepID=UPI0033FE84C0